MNIPQFHNKALYEQVFIHRSYLNEAGKNFQSNERLEFLGDSILSYVVSSFIYSNFQDLEEGELTNLRSSLTNTITLYEISKELNLGSYLKLSKGEEESGGRENKTILANTLEALIGGLYIDQGIENTGRFILEILDQKIDKNIQTEYLKDPKSRLQEKLQGQYKTSPVYKIINEEGPDHMKVYSIGVYLNDKLLASGTGNSKQEAEKVAAKNALENV